MPAVKQFIARHAANIVGVLHGWDRMVFHGTLGRGRFNSVRGVRYYLNVSRILLKYFVEHAKMMTRTLIHSSLEEAQRLGRPVHYLPSSSTRKEEVARGLLLEHPVEQGLICVLTCVEPCVTFEVRGCRETQRLELVKHWGKCLQLYHYYLDPVFGFMHARIQTWFPFSVQICMNGREWLARRMYEKGLTYERNGNCFPSIGDVGMAQSLMDQMLQLNWPRELERFARRLNPAHEAMFPGFPIAYYWTMDQTEWATDISFASSQYLAGIYPQLASGAIAAFRSNDVMRFLGKRPDARFQGEITTDYKHRLEGIRVKHRMDANSVKMYDKGGRILRVETTINNPRPFKVFREKQGQDKRRPQWLRMRRSVADQYRRAEVSQKANERYLDALASLDTTQRLQDLVQPVTTVITRHGKRVRGLHPWSEQDRALFEFVAAPEHLLAGFRNSDMVQALYPQAQSIQDKRRAAARISYRIRILRAHGLIVKLPRTRRYRISRKGREITSAILLAQRATVQHLAKAVA
jgi:hypothetical protein